MLMAIPKQGGRMKTAFLASASVAALMVATGAQAADLSQPSVYKAPPAPAAPPPSWTWTGFYVGGTVGAVGGHDTVTNAPGNGWLDGPVNNNAVGVIGGLEAGYNWQISQLVLGIEGDVSGSSLNRSVSAPALGPFVTDTFSSRLNSLGTIRGRLGWVFDRMLLYGTGGVAFANLRDQLVDTSNPFTATPGSSLTGWTAGGGIEYALTDHWTAKAEYLHVGFAQRTVTSSDPSYIFNFKDSLDIGRVGINYKF